VANNADGTVAASGGEDGDVFLWNTTTKGLLQLWDLSSGMVGEFLPLRVDIIKA